MTIVLIALYAALAGKQIAVVDLPAPWEIKTQDNGPKTIHVRGGGRAYDSPVTRPLPGAPTINVRLGRVTQNPGGLFLTDSIDVVLTNTGDGPLSVPIGTDPVPLLRPPAKDRRVFFFNITLGKAGRRLGFASSASNGEHPESSLVVQPGDSVDFKVTFLRPPEDAPAHPTQEISASVRVNRNVLDKGIDWIEEVGEPVFSENTVPLP